MSISHCVKSVQMRSFFWPLFSCIQSEYRKIWIRKISVFGHFSRSVWYSSSSKISYMHSLGNYIRSIYYNVYWLTLYFQMQFINVNCTATARSAITSSLNKEQLSAKWQRDLKAKKRKYHDGPVKKRQTLKKRYKVKKNL